MPRKRKVVVFIDGPNLRGMQKGLDYRIYYDQMARYLETKYQIVRLEIFERSRTNREILRLQRQAGFTVTIVPTPFEVDPVMGGTIKLLTRQDTPTVLVVAGDGAYMKPVQSCLDKGIKAIILSSSDAINTCYWEDPRIEIVRLEDVIDQFGVHRIAFEEERIFRL